MCKMPKHNNTVKKLNEMKTIGFTNIVVLEIKNVRDLQDLVLTRQGNFMLLLFLH